MQIKEPDLKVGDIVSALEGDHQQGYWINEGPVELISYEKVWWGGTSMHYTYLVNSRWYERSELTVKKENDV